MALFDYTGQLRSGQMFQGTLEADSQQHAQAVLGDMGVRTTALRPTKRTAYVAPLSLDDMLFFNEQLAAMTKSAVPLHEGLRHLATDVGSRKLKRLLLDLADDLVAGTPLEQAIEKQHGRFPGRYADVVRAGLKTGDLGGTLYGVTAHLRLKSHFRRVLIELAAYPLIVLGLSLLILSFFMRVLMPELEEIMHDIGARMSQTLAWAFGVSHVWPSVELGILVAGVVAIAVAAATYVPGGAVPREWLLRRVPGFAQVYWSSVLARFAHTSALAACSGTPLNELIAASGSASGSPALAGAARRVASRLSEGQALDEAARGERNLPALWTCVVSSASQRGELPATLEELARMYEQRSQQWITTVRMLLGPLLLLLLGLVLGSVISVVFLIFSTVLRGLMWY